MNVLNKPEKRKSIEFIKIKESNMNIREEGGQADPLEIGPYKLYWTHSPGVTNHLTFLKLLARAIDICQQLTLYFTSIIISKKVELVFLYLIRVTLL